MKKCEIFYQMYLNFSIFDLSKIVAAKNEASGRITGLIYKTLVT